MQKDGLYLDDKLYENISDESIAWEIQKEKEEKEIAQEIANKRSRKNKKTNKAWLMTGMSNNRIENDIYNTPTSAITALLKREPFSSGVILEPACSIGNISKALESYYPYKTVISSDLRDSDDIYGEKGLDFLSNEYFKNSFIESVYNNVRSIDVISNPHYSYTIEFIKQAKKIATHKIAFLLKLNALGGIKRYQEVWSDKEFPLKAVYVFCKRLDFGLLSSPTLEYCFCVWERGCNGLPIIDWITNWK